MNIMIVGGKKKSDFLLDSLIKKNYKVTLIHDDEKFCKLMSRKHNAIVVHGDGSKPYILEDANVDEMDIVIAMTTHDPTNLVICQLTKKVYGVDKVFSSVNNPKNVDVFKQLGIDIAISATYLITKVIEQMVTVNEISELIPVAEGKIVMMEIVVKKNYPICNKILSEADIPDEAVIGCVVKSMSTIIPNGTTKIIENDRLIILSETSVQDKVIEKIIGR